MKAEITRGFVDHRLRHAREDGHPEKAKFIK
jgi:hypothetical protein